MTQIATTEVKLNNLRAVIGANYKAIGAVLPKHITPERLARVAINAAIRTPKLLDCSQESFLAAMLEAATLGLEPGVAGQCWILPYKGVATFIAGYKGLVQLCWRSGEIAQIGAHVVYEKDEFDYQNYPPVLKHKAHRGKDRGAMVAAYAYAELKNGGKPWLVMEADAILAIKKRSPAASSDSSPWNNPNDEPAMWRKTALRQLVKLLPMSVEVQRVAENDERADLGLPQDFAAGLDPKNEVKQPEDAKPPAGNGDGKPQVDQETGEIESAPKTAKSTAGAMI
jgi:recombination protein RecT